jgi:hypothetical protein
MGSENAHGSTQNAENGFGFDFLRVIPQRCDEFLNHIIRVTGDETRVSFVNVETKEQSKKVDAHTFTKHAENFKQTLSADG